MDWQELHQQLSVFDLDKEASTQNSNAEYLKYYDLDILLENYSAHLDCTGHAIVGTPAH